MDAQDLTSRAFNHYLERIRGGQADLYAAHQVCQNLRLAEAKDLDLVRLAMRQLIAGDPWYLTTGSAMPTFDLHILRATDLVELTPVLGVGPVRGLAAMLRARLWFYGDGGPYRKDRAGRARLRRALGYLQKVPRAQRDLAWQDMVVGCYRVLDYAKYVRAAVAQLEATAPEWRAGALHRVLDAAATRKDWASYDRFRRDWDRLPADRFACECYTNDVATWDGLRMAAARQWDAMPALLARAADVRGCAHLNSGGFRLDLARLLVARRKQLPAVATYLARAVQSPSNQDALALQREVAAL